jgi:hypothetical protein
MKTAKATVSLAVLAIVAASGSALATNGTTGGSVSTSQSGVVTPPPTEITITGDPGVVPPGGGGGGGPIALDGDYAVAAGGTRTTAVLGAVTFDPAGTVVGGSLSVIGAPGVAPAPTPTPEPTPPATTGGATLIPAVATPTVTTTTGGDVIGGGVIGGGVIGGDDGLPPTDPGGPTDLGTGGGATVTDCTVTGGSYTLAAGGGGEAQLQLDCGGSALAVTWRLFVSGTQGMAVAQQFRAVQLEALPGAVDAEIVDLTLTLR